MAKPPVYEIRVRGGLGEGWSDWFDGLSILPASGGDTLLRGPLADQAALHGVLLKIRDLGLTLVALKTVEVQQSGEGDDIT
ncbi:MAG: hypothetical protein EHM70_21135 [Chloroflexota bacterium]|nr:MAG: hypothetical protein EHM70_21135 [Chloroflexota bacterium]